MMRIRNLALSLAFPVSALAQSGTTTVAATSNLFRAGGNDLGGAYAIDGSLPTYIALSSGVNRILQLTARGSWSCGIGHPYSGPENGHCAALNTSINSYNRIAGVQAPGTMLLMGVFLGNTLPATPPVRRTYANDGSDFGLAGYTDLQLGQIFFIGDGLRGLGIGPFQDFFVPDAATALYLGVVDADAFKGDPYYFDDNQDAMSVDYRIGAVDVTTAPEPASQLLVLTGLIAIGIGAYSRHRRQDPSGHTAPAR